MAVLTAAQRALFEGKNWVAIATLGKNGTPRNTILWVDVDEDHVLVNGARSRAWIKNLRRNPNVALTIYDHERPQRRVTVIGVAVEITTAGAEDHIEKLAQKYVGRSYGNHDPENPRVLVRIRPEAVTSMGVQ